MLFLGLGSGLGSALLVDGKLIPMELAHLSAGEWTFEESPGIRALERYGKKKWRVFVAKVVARLQTALQLDDVAIGGGNVKKLKELPPGCRAGDNANSFLGGFRMWEEPDIGHVAPAAKPGVRKQTRPKNRKDMKSSKV